MNEAKNYTIRVLNDQYVVKSDETQEHIDASAHMVNQLINEILEHNKHIDHKKVAILAALRIASSALHAQEELGLVRNKEQDMIMMLEQQLCQLDVKV